MPTKKFESGSFEYFGHFCSFECMKTYNLCSNNSSKYNIFNYIHELCGKNVKFAPMKEQLECFGGSISQEKFEKSARIKPDKLYLSPMKPIKLIYETHSENIHTDTKEHYDNNAHTTDQNTQQLKLKRKTPIKSSQHTLEKSMGIFKVKS